MRRLLAMLVILYTAACASPAPCTQALCPWHYDGSYRVTGWTRSVTVTPGTPAIPIVSDSSIEVLSGRVEFINRRTIVRAAEGSSFRFSVSSDDAHVPSLLVSSGEVTVALSSTSAPSPVERGVPFLLPVYKK